MKNKLYFTSIIFFLIHSLIAQENKILWDFGVIINSPLENTNTQIIKNNLEINEYYNGKALISNLFVPPIIKSNEKTVLSKKINNYSKIKNYSFKQIKFLITKLTVQKLYKNIIEVINELNIDNYKNNESLEINYWLANALTQTGKYKLAENVILNDSKNDINEQSSFLLATIYEHQNKKQKAQKEYLNFIQKYPNSDYKISAQIKAKMLDS